MALAAQPGSPVSRLVMNDAGPVVQKAALERIAAYLGSAPEFEAIEDAERHVRTLFAGFGPHDDAQWRHLTEAWVRRAGDGRYRARYDPRIAEPYRAAMPKGDLEMWAVYDAVRCPTLVLRGERSDLLLAPTAAEMARRGPKAKVVEIPGVGHAPTLMEAGQVSVVRDFLLEGGPS
jgi:pimeloyl-ACP methyl ester carboxylesterase